MTSTRFAARHAGPAGILLTGLVHGRAGFRALLSCLLTWQVSARWYAVALLTAPLVMAVTLFALNRASLVTLPGIFTSDDKASLLLFAVAVALGAGFIEELGWTGFAVPHLRRRHGAPVTGLIVGVLWGAWHFLVNVWASGRSSGALSLAVFLPAILVSLLVGALPAYRMLMLVVYDRTRSLVVLMHVSLTASTLLLSPSATGASLLTFDLALGAVLWTMVGAVTLAGTRRGPP